MVLAYHAVFTAYGFWLPNDPRGSWSEFVGAWELLRFGKPTRLATRVSVANRPHNADLRARAKAALQYPPVQFSGVQARGIARGFARYVKASGIVVLACAILPNHVHFVILRAGRPIDGIVNHLKGAATRQLVTEGIHPMTSLARGGRHPKMWARGCWKVFLDSVETVHRAVQYVEDNPPREGKRQQEWSFVQRDALPSLRSGRG